MTKKIEKNLCSKGKHLAQNSTFCAKMENRKQQKIYAHTPPPSPMNAEMRVWMVRTGDVHRGWVAGDSLFIGPGGLSMRGVRFEKAGQPVRASPPVWT